MHIYNGSIRVAVSAINDPNPSIFNFKIGNCPDQPFITVSSDKVAISFNTLTKGCVQPFLGAQTLLINKDDMVNARPPAFHITKPDRNSFREFPVRTSATDEKIFLASIPSTGSGAVKVTTFTGVITTTPHPASASSSQTIPFLQKIGVLNVPPDGHPRYRLHCGIADKIKCPTLVLEAEKDDSFPGQPQKVFNTLTCPKMDILFTEEEGADEHCQCGASALSNQRIFDWLDQTFQKSGAL